MVNIPRSKHQILVHSFFLPFLISGLVVFLWYGTPLKKLITSWEESASDYLMLLNKPESRDKTNPITLILLDEKGTMTYGYRSPIPRLLLADLIDFLVLNQAKVIGLDVLLDRQYHHSEDRRLRSSLSKAGNRVVLADIHPDQREHENQAELNRVDSYFSAVTPAGYAQVKLGSGDLARWFRFDRTDESDTFNHLIYQTYTDRSFSSESELCSESKPCWVRFNYDEKNALLNKETTAFPILNVEETFLAPESLFKDRIVLIGSGISDLGDVFLTPFSQSSNQYQPVFGVQLHAITLDMMLNNRFIRELSLQWVIAGLCLTTFLFGIVVSISRPWVSMLLLFCSLVMTILASVFLFLQMKLLLPLIGPVTCLISVYLLNQVFTHNRLQSYSRKIKNRLDLTNLNLFQAKKHLDSVKKEKETALENERKRIAQDIHDDLGQLLTALRFDLGFLSQQESVSHGEFSKKTQEINRKIGQIIQSTRHIISDLRPKILEDFGLAAAVEWLVENFEKSVEVKCETIINLKQVEPDTERSLALFRILQESLNNVSKHAKADQVRIKLLETRQQIVLQVTDNGVGFSFRQEPGAKSYGLSGIKERITLFKGSYKIRSLIGIGTTLLVQLPTSPD